MEFTGRYAISAPIERVWEGILDPAVLKACIPGCEKLEQPADGQYVATVKLKIGPVSATFNGKVTLSDANPPFSVQLNGEGQGGVAGFAKGGAQVTLECDGDVTNLSYVATAAVGGKAGTDRQAPDRRRGAADRRRLLQALCERDRFAAAHHAGRRSDRGGARRRWSRWCPASRR